MAFTELLEAECRLPDACTRAETPSGWPGPGLHRQVEDISVMSRLYPASKSLLSRKQIKREWYISLDVFVGEKSLAGIIITKGYVWSWIWLVASQWQLLESDAENWILTAFLKKDVVDTYLMFFLHEASSQTVCRLLIFNRPRLVFLITWPGGGAADYKHLWLRDSPCGSMTHLHAVLLDYNGSDGSHFCK